MGRLKFFSLFILLHFFGISSVISQIYEHTQNFRYKKKQIEIIQMEYTNPCASIYFPYVKIESSKAIQDSINSNLQKLFYFSGGNLTPDNFERVSNGACSKEDMTGLNNVSYSNVKLFGKFLHITISYEACGANCNGEIYSSIYDVTNGELMHVKYPYALIGNIKGRTICMLLDMQEKSSGKVSGVYYYEKYRKNIDLDGVLAGDVLLLNEFYKSKKTGQFTLDLSNEEKIKGVWEKNSNSKELSVLMESELRSYHFSNVFTYSDERHPNYRVYTKYLEDFEIDFYKPFPYPSLKDELADSVLLNKLETLNTDYDFVIPGSSLEIDLNNKSYYIYAIGSIGDYYYQETGEFQRSYDYKLFLACFDGDSISSELILRELNQPIVESGFFVKIKFAGDLDGDDLLDLVIAIRPDKDAIYLSSYTQENYDNKTVSGIKYLGPKQLKFIGYKSSEMSQKDENSRGYILSGTDDYKFKGIDDTENYDYSSYHITTNLHEEGIGEVIEISNKINSDTFILEESGSFFKGIIDHYMIITRDQCTGDHLQIYDLTTQEVIFNSFYEGGLRVVDDKVYFKENVQIKDEANRPECSQEMIDKGYSIGYVEKLIYDLNKKELSRTETYECSYHEF